MPFMLLLSFHILFMVITRYFVYGNNAILRVVTTANCPRLTSMSIYRTIYRKHVPRTLPEISPDESQICRPLRSARYALLRFRAVFSCPRRLRRAPCVGPSAREILLYSRREPSSEDRLAGQPDADRCGTSR